MIATTPLEAQPMIYELRTYYAAPGKTEALLNRFRTLTMRVFDRHGMKVVGFWTPKTATSETGDLIYILAFESEGALQDAWAGFRADPQWVEGKAKSEVDGALTSRVVSHILLPTDFCPPV
jgi:hypothetical protein